VIRMQHESRVVILQQSQPSQQHSQCHIDHSRVTNRERENSLSLRGCEEHRRQGDIFVHHRQCLDRLVPTLCLDESADQEREWNACDRAHQPRNYCMRIYALIARSAQ